MIQVWTCPRCLLPLTPIKYHLCTTGLGNYCSEPLQLSKGTNDGWRNTCGTDSASHLSGFHLWVKWGSTGIPVEEHSGTYPSPFPAYKCILKLRACISHSATNTCSSSKTSDRSLTGLSHPMLGHSCSLKPSSQPFPDPSAPSAPPQEIFSSSYYPVIKTIEY